MKINPAWQLRETCNAIRRFLTQQIDVYTVERLRVEFKYAQKRLDELEKGLTKAVNPDNDMGM